MAGTDAEFLFGKRWIVRRNELSKVKTIEEFQEVLKKTRNGKYAKLFELINNLEEIPGNNYLEPSGLHKFDNSIKVFDLKAVSN